MTSLGGVEGLWDDLSRLALPPARWFQFFHSLVDAYAKILFPTPETVHELQNDVQDKLHIMDKCEGGKVGIAWEVASP